MLILLPFTTLDQVPSAFKRLAAHLPIKDVVIADVNMLQALVEVQQTNNDAETRDVTPRDLRKICLQALDAKVADITPPATAITFPANNSTVSRSTNVMITATATDISGIMKVDFYVNSVLKCTDTSSPYSCIWLVPSQKSVVYSLVSKAYDTAGNIKTSAVISVTAR